MEWNRIRKTITWTLIILFALSQNSCNHDYTTKKKYIINNKADKITYLADSTYLAEVVKFMAINNISPFKGPKFYDDSTAVIIDTILYNKNFNLFAFWVITKIPTYKLNDSEIKKPYFYNGVCMYASRSRKKDVIKVYECGSVEFLLFQNLVDVQDALSDFSFKYNKTFKRLDAKKIYNMDDIRFWSEFSWTETLKNPYCIMKDTKKTITY